jgi:hypothetical protein
MGQADNPRRDEKQCHATIRAGAKLAADVATSGAVGHQIGEPGRQ